MTVKIKQYLERDKAEYDERDLEVERLVESATTVTKPPYWQLG
jgi:hypothetical protein